MVNELLLLMGQAPPPPSPVAVLKNEGGGAEIRTIPRLQPPLTVEFRKGFLITGAIQRPKLELAKPTIKPVSFHPLLSHFPVTGQIQQKISGHRIIRGSVGYPQKLQVTTVGRIARNFQEKFTAQGQVNESVMDLREKIADLKYEIYRKQERYDEERTIPPVDVSELRFFKDPECTVPHDFEFDPTNVGSTVELRFYMRNTSSKSLFGVQLGTEQEDLSVEPSEINVILPGQVVVGKMVWKTPRYVEDYHATVTLSASVVEDD